MRCRRSFWWIEYRRLMRPSRVASRPAACSRSATVPFTFSMNSVAFLRFSATRRVSSL